MKLRITYTTSERKYLSTSSYKHIPKTIEIEPIAIKRTPLCWAGATIQRYSYRAVFLAPDDAEFKMPDGTCSANIVRSNNSHFNPKKLVFINNTCLLNDEPKAP